MFLILLISCWAVAASPLMAVSKHVEKASQSTSLKLKRRCKCVGIGVPSALIRKAIGRCWVCGIGSSTALLLSDAMLLLTKERSGLYPRFQRLLLNEQGSFGSWIRLKWWASDRSPLSHQCRAAKRNICQNVRT